MTFVDRPFFLQGRPPSPRRAGTAGFGHLACGAATGALERLLYDEEWAKMSLEKQLMRLSLRQLGELVEVPIEPSVEDREGFDKLADLPLRLLAREFRSKAALRAFVLHRLDRAEDRKRVRRIAALFERGVT